jgi:uncharacterized protein
VKGLKAPPNDWDCLIPISRIPKNGEPFTESFTLPLESAIEHWGQEYTPVRPVWADVETTFANERILAVISVRADFSLPCSRCLRETALAIAGDLRYLFSLRPLRDEQDSDEGSLPDEDGDVDVIPLDSFQTELDLSVYIWEVLVLNLPERVLCSEGCKGLCPICGLDRNDGDCGCREDETDPRLAVLRDLDV